MHLISEVSNGKTLSYHRRSPSMLQIPMVMMLHTFANPMDSQLGSFGMTAGKLVPVEYISKDKKGTKRIQILCVTVNNKGSVSGSSNTAM